MITFRPSAKFDKDAAVVLISQLQLERRSLGYIYSKDIRENIISLAKQKQFHGESGEIFPLVVKQRVILLVGLGKTPEATLTSLRVCVRNALNSNYLKKIKNIEIIPHEQRDDVIFSIIEGFLIGTYSWKKYFSKSSDDGAVDSKHVFLPGVAKASYLEAITICEGVNLARDLINENADIANSAYLEKTIRSLIKGNRNASLEILNQKEMKKKGLNLHLAVNQGSPNEPKLIIVRYAGAGNNEKYTAVVGKGITFDTGGLNLKPTGHIETMRCDMSGASAVIGTLKNILKIKVRKNILFAVAVAENVTGSRSYKPGDVFQGYSGKTVEIGNTDAEGRLVLADAIAYVVKNYKPFRIIDIATLTGACVVALGNDYTGLVTSSDEFSRALVKSSNETDDRVWRLPSYPELKDSMKSNVADIKNTSVLRGAGGAITAAEFLRQFTNDTPWAHLDIAGTAFNEGKSRSYFGHGATGAGVRLLTRYLTKY